MGRKLAIDKCGWWENSRREKIWGDWGFFFPHKLWENGLFKLFFWDCLLILSYDEKLNQHLSSTWEGDSMYLFLCILNGVNIIFCLTENTITFIFICVFERKKKNSVLEQNKWKT